VVDNKIVVVRLGDGANLTTHNIVHIFSIFTLKYSNVLAREAMYFNKQAFISIELLGKIVPHG